MVIVDCFIDVVVWVVMAVVVAIVVAVSARSFRLFQRLRLLQTPMAYSASEFRLLTSSGVDALRQEAKEEV